MHLIHLKPSLLLVKAHFIIFNSRDYHYSKLKQWLREFGHFWAKSQNLFKIALKLAWIKIVFKLQFIDFENFIHLPNLFSHIILKLFFFAKIILFWAFIKMYSVNFLFFWRHFRTHFTFSLQNLINSIFFKIQGALYK